MGLISEKMEVLCAELNERAKTATGSYSVTGDSLQYIYSEPVTKKHQNIRSRCLHEFSKMFTNFSSQIFLHRYFLKIVIMVTEQLY